MSQNMRRRRRCVMRTDQPVINVAVCDAEHEWSTPWSMENGSQVDCWKCRSIDFTGGNSTRGRMCSRLRKEYDTSLLYMPWNKQKSRRNGQAIFTEISEIHGKASQDFRPYLLVHHSCHGRIPYGYFWLIQDICVTVLKMEFWIW